MTKIRANSITRRDFLSIGSAAALAPAVLSLNAHAAGLVETDPSASQRATELLSVGYWRGSEDRADLASLLIATRPSRPISADAGMGARSESRVIRAMQLNSGDARLAQTGAHVTIHGLHEADGSLLRPEIEGLAAAIHFRVNAGGEMKSIPCSAWNYRRSPVRNASPSVGMTVPVDQESGLRLSIERGNGSVGLAGRVLGKALFGRRAETGGPSAASGDVCFTLGDEAHSPKLRRGVYFIAAQSHPGQTPAWEQYRFDETHAGRALIRHDLSGEEPADFDYLVVSVDQAAADVA